MVVLNMVVGRLVSFWEGQFSGPMLNSGGYLENLVRLQPTHCQKLEDPLGFYESTVIMKIPRYHYILGAGIVKDFFGIFTPQTWGCMIQFDDRIFFKGG